MCRYPPYFLCYASVNTYKIYVEKKFKKFNANFIIWLYISLYLAVIALPSCQKNDLCGYFMTMSSFLVTNWSESP